MSIFKKITLLFIISFILMAIIGSWIDNINSKRMENLIKEKYIKVIDEILRNIENEKVLNEIFQKNELKIKKDFDSINNEILYQKKYDFGNVTIIKESFEDEFIIEIKYFENKYILKTPDEEKAKLINLDDIDLDNDDDIELDSDIDPELEYIDDYDDIDTDDLLNDEGDDISEFVNTTTTEEEDMTNLDDEE